MFSHFASHLIALHGCVYSFLSAKIIIPVDDVDGEVTEWKDHSENKKQSNLIFSIYIVPKTVFTSITYIASKI